MTTQNRSFALHSLKLKKWAFVFFCAFLSALPYASAQQVYQQTDESFVFIDENGEMIHVPQGGGAFTRLDGVGGNSETIDRIGGSSNPPPQPLKPLEGEPINLNNNNPIKLDDMPQPKSGVVVGPDGKIMGASPALEASCEGAAQSALKHLCTGTTFAGLAGLAFSQRGNIANMNAQEACKESKRINKIMAATNIGLVTGCITALTKCVGSCYNAANAFSMAGPAGQAQAQQYRQMASQCSSERNRFAVQGGLQITQNIMALKNKCETIEGQDTPEIQATGDFCDTLPPEVQDLCREDPQQMCENPRFQRMPFCTCQQPGNQNKPECQGFQMNPPHLPTVDLPPGFCKQNPTACQRDGLTLPPGDLNPSDYQPLDSNVDNIGFDPTSLGLADPDGLSPEYTGNGDLSSFGTNPAGLAHTASGGGGGGLLGGGGAGGGGGGLAPSLGEEGQGEEGYDTDVLEGVGGGTAAASQGYGGGAGGGSAGKFTGKSSYKGLNLKPFDPRKYMPKFKKDKQGKQGQPPLSQQITPANGLSNWQKVSRVMNSKRALLTGGNNYIYAGPKE